MSVLYSKESKRGTGRGRKIAKGNRRSSWSTACNEKQSCRQMILNHPIRMKAIHIKN